jgi:hypothetical protein
MTITALPDVSGLSKGLPLHVSPMDLFAIYRQGLFKKSK